MMTSINPMKAFVILVAWLGFAPCVLCNIVVHDSQSNMTVATFPDLEAGFGPVFPSTGIQGRIVNATPANACKPLQPASQYLFCDNGCIVMIARGGQCEFADKVWRAEVAGYEAAIVYNYPDCDSVVKMGGNSKHGSKVAIPSTFVGYSIGMKLRTMFGEHPEYVAIITEADDIDYRMYLWPFAVVVGVCFLMIMSFLIVKFVRDHVKVKLTLLSKKHLKKIPIKKFKKGQYYDTCAVCLDEYEDGEKIRILPCDHAYHMKCIDPWLTQNKKTCPVCKRRVIPGKDPNSDSDSDDDSGRRERTPLLRPTPQSSHGSINQDASTSSGAMSSGAMHSIDETQGAVGGSLVQVQVKIEQEMDGGEQREARRQRKERREERADKNSNPSEDGSEERKTERKDKRKKRKEKKREGRKAKRQEAGTEDTAQLLSGQPEDEQQAEEVAVAVEAEVQSVAPAEAAAEQYINPSYSESQEVIVPGSDRKQELSEVV